MPQRQTSLPIAVIGAGPIGLSAAAHLLARGETPLILEAGFHGVTPEKGRVVEFWVPRVRMLVLRVGELTAKRREPE